jgi:hypothetical protein
MTSRRGQHTRLNKEIIMEWWMWLLIGVPIGVGITLAVRGLDYAVKAKEFSEEDKAEREAMYTSMQVALEDNAKLRIALSAGEMIGEAKKVAAVTMAALGVTTEEKATRLPVLMSAVKNDVAWWFGR